MKKRIDVLMLERKLADTRTRAQALILAGLVFVDKQKVDKPGMQVDTLKEVTLKKVFPYVSRGALKLEKAAREFSLDFREKIVVDIGSSTGGFTDFVLDQGAAKVYAVDVGRGQLAHKLRLDPRVAVMEKTDFRSIEAFPEKVDFFLADVSFISLTKIIPKIGALRSPNSQAVLLIKPQFEVGKKEADRGRGVIRNPQLRKETVEKISGFAASCGFEVLGVATSPITGAKGNIEYLLWLG